MAKGAAKRETNAQRREREYNRRTDLGIAKRIAETICERRKSKADLAPGIFADLSAKELNRLGYHPETKRWMQPYTWIGQTLCELCPFDEAPSKFLRLVADFLEGKPPQRNKSDLCCDDAITKAYIEAGRRSGAPDIRPSFSEFHKIFLNQPSLPSDRRNIKTISPSERSLRRSLKRLGCPTRPDKRGRPKEK
jgi:hypothetical protein